ncbi:MAG: ATP-dependent Clp protease ATP-binding subunit, partial [Planctomycetaceae bacterium]|nr:ATP-dependent Clp protease ATP-binding subunit [Planctomycetaceae bacterium]
EDSLIQLDMSEYMEKHNVSRLVGAPPGYVGYEEGGQLTEKIRRRPYAVVLLDEIEKAHPDVFNMLLQIMEEGHLTDSFGRTVDFKNVILIMTTNAGANKMAHGGSMGLHTLREADDSRSYDEMKTHLMHELQKQFKPEFLGRLDEVVVFRKLTRNELMEIVDIELNKVYERLQEKGLKMVLSDEARGFIIDRGEADDGLDYGARPLRRSVERFIEDPLSEELLRGSFEGKNVIRVNVKEVGDQKQLIFDGEFVEDAAKEKEAEVVGVGSGDEPSKE